MLKSIEQGINHICIQRVCENMFIFFGDKLIKINLLRNNLEASN